MITPTIIACLLLGFVAGIWVGWLVHGERRQRADDIKLERQAEQVQALETSNAQLRRQLQQLQTRTLDAANLHHRQLQQLKSLRETLDEQLLKNRRMDNMLQKAKTLITESREERRLSQRQLKLLIKRTQDSRRTTTAVLSPVPAAPTLQSVKGIGPALAEKLSELGITELSMLAVLDDDAVDELDQKLRFPGRIRRDRWVEQARELIDFNTDNSECA